MSRVLFVLEQGWLEPHMICNYRPDLVLGTRCMILDPAVYAGFYYPRIGRRMSLERKLRAAQRLSRLPFRHLYFFLKTPASTAVERIYRRIAGAPAYRARERDYWLHLHENEAVLSELGARFSEALATARALAPIDVVEIDTCLYDEAGVAALIDRHVRAALTASGRSAIEP